MRRILITGGLGFVGRALVRRAVGEFDVHVLDNLRSGGHRARSMDLRAFTLHAGDIRDRARVADVMRAVQPDVVAHLAAIHFIPECEANPQLAIDTNVAGTVNLLEHTPAGARFLNVSSAAVYAPVSGPLDERATATGPMDVYGWTKLQTEHYASYFAQRRGFTAWSVRLFNVVGPGETNPHLVPELVYQLKSGARELKVGNVTPRRDFIDVEDAAEGFLRLALAPTDRLPAHGPDAVVNLGTGSAHSVGDILDRLRGVAGVDFGVVVDPARRRAVDREVLMAATDRLRYVTGWVPERPLDATVASLWTETADDLRPAVSRGATG